MDTNLKQFSSLGQNPRAKGREDSQVLEMGCVVYFDLRRRRDNATKRCVAMTIDKSTHNREKADSIDASTQLR